MSAQEITARLGKDEESPSATVKYDFGSTLGEAVEKFGEEVVYKRFCAAVTIDIQALIRRNLGGETPASTQEIQATLNEWKPGVQRARKSQKEKAMDLLEAMSDADKAAILAELS